MSPLRQGQRIQHADLFVSRIRLFTINHWRVVGMIAPSGPFVDRATYEWWLAHGGYVDSPAYIEFATATGTAMGLSDGQSGRRDDLRSIAGRIVRSAFEAESVAAADSQLSIDAAIAAKAATTAMLAIDSISPLDLASIWAPFVPMWANFLEIRAHPKDPQPTILPVIVGLLEPRAAGSCLSCGQGATHFLTRAQIPYCLFHACQATALGYLAGLA